MAICESISVNRLSFIFLLGFLSRQEMQVQGLMAKKDTKFGEAFDCVGFFSMPIFIGLLTSLLLIFFTTFAVVAMASIRTPEKFDDPRGQKISVPNE